MDRLRRDLENVDRKMVENVLSKDYLSPSDFPVLFSKTAEFYLEQMALKSAAITSRRFGKVINLYAPLYLSNECVNQCAYCGFSKSNDILRITQPIEKVIEEGDFLWAEGFRHILLVSGEAPRSVGQHYLTDIIKNLHGKFASISLEIYPLDRAGYEKMGQAGADGLTLYQETYCPDLYGSLHSKGPKRDFAVRLDAHDHAGRTGYRSLGIGALLGLGDWRLEALLLAYHGRYLTKKYWRSKIAVSFPRIRKAPGGFTPPCPVSDTQLIHLMCGLRLILPDCELVISTREEPSFRDNIIGLGVTRMSAGSKTNPGGYISHESSGNQFHVQDERSAKEVAAMILNKGHEPIWKDFDKEFVGY